MQAVFLPDRGARLHRLRVFGHDLLRTPPDLEAYGREPFFWGSFVMAPWCNRIGTEPVTIGSKLVSVASNFHDGSAIHGQVHERRWEVQPDAVLRVEGGGDGWPWRYEVSMRATVGEGSLRLDLALTNRSDEPMPGGLGIHPWFRRPVLIAIRGEAVFSPNRETPPHAVPVDGELDLRHLQDMPTGLDATWNDLPGFPVNLQWPHLELEASIRVGSPPVFIVAASPADLDAIAVEPQTHAPQGLRRLLNGEPGAMTVVPPGQTISLDVEIAFNRLLKPARLH